MRLASILLAILALSACSNKVANDPSKWSCQSLIGPIIEMSKERSPTVLEITDASERGRQYGPEPSISCFGRAEWDRGEGFITYGAHVSETGNVFLEYRQM